MKAARTEQQKYLLKHLIHIMGKQVVEAGHGSKKTHRAVKLSGPCLLKIPSHASCRAVADRYQERAVVFSVGGVTQYWDIVEEHMI